MVIRLMAVSDSGHNPAEFAEFIRVVELASGRRSSGTSTWVVVVQGSSPILLAHHHPFPRLRTPVSYTSDEICHRLANKPGVQHCRARHTRQNSIVKRRRYRTRPWPPVTGLPAASQAGAGRFRICIAVVRARHAILDLVQRVVEWAPRGRDHEFGGAAMKVL